MREYTIRESEQTVRYLFRCSRKRCPGIKAADVVVHRKSESYYDPATNQGGRFKPVATYNGDSQLQRLLCPVCGASMYAEPVKGYVTGHICDARCTNAKGPDCECSCGGANHGSAHL